jgi:uncharacterized protein involved in exopolysaccharide biosynthesis
MGNINSLEDLLLFLRRFWLLIGGLVIVGSLATVFYALQQPHSWEAAAVVRVEGSSINPETQGGPDLRLSAARLQQIEQDILSRDAVIEMIARHRLFTDLPALSLAEKIMLMRTSVQFLPLRPEGQPFGPEQPITSVVIFSRQADPDTAANVANDIAAQLVAQSSARQSEGARQALDFYAREETRISAEIAALDAEVTAFKNANIDTLPEGLQSRRDTLAQLGEEIRAQARDIAALSQDLALLRERRNPRAVELRQIEALEAQITAQESAQAGLIAERDDISARNSRTPLVEAALAGFSRRQQQLEEQLATVIRRRTEAETTQRLSAQAQTERFELLETALPPEVPLRSQRRKLAALGLLGSLGLGLGLAFVLDLRNPALRTSKQFERATRIRPVIAIPTLPAASDKRRTV